ncbi:F-box only protein 46 [Antennarius striatus]|uniref:F-box only protein 46 n=1 Tax=Antennarius striatus TaxID=241820 RepID=UPI0035B04B8C
MDRDTFSHIRLWCPRPFGTYSQNKARSPGSGGGSGGTGAPAVCKGEPSPDARRAGDGTEDAGMMLGGQAVDGGVDGVGSENTPPESEAVPSSLTHTQTPPAPPAAAPASPPAPGPQVEDGRVMLDTWYVIKPGNTKEKIAFFVAHQFSGGGQPRPSAMKVKGNWATDCSKAKRRRRCSSYDPPTRSHASEPHIDPSLTSPSPDEPLPGGATETDLLSVAEMVALVEQRTAMALQGIVAVHGGQHPPTGHGLTPHHQHTLLRSTASDPSPVQPPRDEDASHIQTDQTESCRVAEAIAHFESQNLENRLHLGGAPGVESCNQDRRRRGDSISTPPPPPSHSHGEVRIAFRVSNLDPRSQLEPSGRSRCMFMSCGGGGGQAAPRGKEKITCDLYQLVSPSSRDPSSLLLAATAAAPKADADPDRPAGSDPTQDPTAGEKKAGGAGRERVTGFHVEVVVTGAVDQCVFYGKDSTENVQEETVCFAVASSGGGGGGAPTDPPSSDDPPPGQLFFFQPPRGAEDDAEGPGGESDRANNNCLGTGVTPGDHAPPADPPGVGDDCSDPSLCRLYRHVSHDFLEIRFQIQRLLEPRQYLLLLPPHILLGVFSFLPTRALAALKCTCHAFRALIDTYGVRAVDSRWNQDPLYRDDPCKQCKRQYARGDVSLCRWHPKPYHHDLPYGRSYWMCCRRTDKDTPGCRVGLHDNNWVQPPPDGSQPPRPRREEAR